MEHDISGRDKIRELFKEFFNQPLWIKEILYYELEKDIESSFIKKSMEFIRRDDVYQLYHPKLTFLGEKEFSTRAKSLKDEMYRFLECCMKKMSLIEILIFQDWSLVEVSNYFVEGLTLQLVEEPSSVYIKETANYMSGKVRLGEYFVKLGRITVEQLDEVLREQRKQREETGTMQGSGELLVKKGFVDEKSIQGILLLKEESSKKFDKSAGVSLGNINISSGQELEKLRVENKNLKEQLNKILGLG